jgi:hypothetical protein
VTAAVAARTLQPQDKEAKSGNVKKMKRDD